MAGYAKYADEAKKAAEVDFNWWKPDKEGESITGKVIYYGDGIGGKFNQKTIKIDDGAGHVWGRGVGTDWQLPWNRRVSPVMISSASSTGGRGQPKTRPRSRSLTL